MDRDVPVEHDLIKDAVAAEIAVLNVDIAPTTTGDRHVRIEGRLGDEENAHVEWAAFPLIYALGLLSFADARPRGVSDMDLVEHDEWTAADMLRHLRFERGQLCFDADYVRGRMMKTTLTVRRDGTLTLETWNRGEAATRWIARLQGKKTVALVGAARTDEDQTSD